MKIEHAQVGPLMVNCYFISEGDKLIIVDPGGSEEIIDDYIKSNKLKPVMIVNTHGHFDHIGAVQYLRKKYDIPFLIHKDDEFLLKMATSSAALFGLPPVETPEVDRNIEDGETVSESGIDIDIIHTPGHSPGGVCLYIKSEKVLITGDTLFARSVGRSDFPYADHGALIKNIKNKIMLLDDDVSVCPGHGEFSSISDEKLFNPFL